MFSIGFSVYLLGMSYCKKRTLLFSFDILSIRVPSNCPSAWEYIDSPPIISFIIQGLVELLTIPDKLLKEEGKLFVILNVFLRSLLNTDVIYSKSSFFGMLLFF